MDPDPPEQLEQILEIYGLSVGKGKVVDGGAYAAPDKAAPAILRGHYPPVVVTSDLDTTYFPEAAALFLSPWVVRQIGREKAATWPRGSIYHGNVGILPLAVSTPLSRLVSNSRTQNSDGNSDIKGPLALGCLVVASAKPVKNIPEDKLTRLVVIGDSDFASNQHFKNGGNSDLFLNAVNWLAEDEQLISIRPKPFTIRKLVISRGASRFISYSGFGLLPLLLIAAGLFVWWRKR